MANTRPTPGDFTGQQKSQQAKQQKTALEEQQAEMSMKNDSLTDDEINGVFDPQNGERLDSVRPSRVIELADEDEFDENEIDDDSETVPTVQQQRTRGIPRRREEEPTYTGHESPEELAPVLAKRRTYTPHDVELAKPSMVTVRLDQDIDDMTYGMYNGEPNNYSFKEGLKYKVPYEVAEHLNERGLIRQWVS